MIGLLKYEFLAAFKPPLKVGEHHSLLHLPPELRSKYGLISLFFLTIAKIYLRDNEPQVDESSHLIL